MYEVIDQMQLNEVWIWKVWPVSTAVPKMSPPTEIVLETKRLPPLTDLRSHFQACKSYIFDSISSISTSKTKQSKKNGKPFQTKSSFRFDQELHDPSPKLPCAIESPSTSLKMKPMKDITPLDTTIMEYPKLDMSWWTWTKEYLKSNSSVLD